MNLPLHRCVWGEVAIRPVRQRDWRALDAELRAGRAWLQQWEATLPGQPAGMPDTRRQVRSMIVSMREGLSITCVIEWHGEIVGQISVAQIAWGAMNSCSIGYWVAERVAGRGIAPTATALICDLLFREWGMHRIEICMLPENAASRRVPEKLGFRPEGLRRGYIHIGDRWRDHLVFALLAEDAPRDGLVAHLAADGGCSPHRGESSLNDSAERRLMP